MTTTVNLNGIRADLELRADRAAFWPVHRMLLVADLHLGKDASFRRSGIGVPIGANEATLSRLATAIRQTGAEHLVVLGDMFHARSSLSQQVQATISRFLEAHSSLQVTLIRGNHDLGIRKLPTSWNVRVEASHLMLDGFCMRHDPGLGNAGDAHDTRAGQSGKSQAAADMEVEKEMEMVAAELILCGHIHPAIQFRDSGAAVRLPCFWLTQNRLIFPAFGDFTGTCVIRPQQEDRVWAVVDNELFDMSNWSGRPSRI